MKKKKIPFFGGFLFYNFWLFFGASLRAFFTKKVLHLNSFKTSMKSAQAAGQYM